LKYLVAALRPARHAPNILAERLEEAKNASTPGCRRRIEAIIGVKINAFNCNAAFAERHD
jgi:hypothetical protein